MHCVRAKTHVAVYNTRMEISKGKMFVDFSNQNSIGDWRVYYNALAITTWTL